MCSRKDYIAIAKVIRDERDKIRQFDPSTHSVGMLVSTKCVAESLCTIFIADNPRFDRRKFLQACGIE